MWQGQGGRDGALNKHRMQAGDSRRRQNMLRTEGAVGLHWEVEWQPGRPQTPGDRASVERRADEDKGR